MNDRAELSALASRLGLWLDEGAPETGLALFTDDAEARTLGGVAKGVKALIAQAQKNHKVPTQHFITNKLIELDGDRAVIQANLLVVFANEEGPRLLGERYELSAVRADDGWRISRVQVGRPVWEIANAA
ncbi:nuclear transport factor 2 family protein [Actinomadura decatromicini]|uniref:Nuclear transport factor 2 family protein n=1 Tax=Actinomadura decatromicini TaxID=2604572 RepID=A0A5D3FRM6_9ACTN|nr:nuclear transport factor 2 family protein [Actinomadura decatromicini]TYK50688.1 nuclear transport factor 2 family protein [Actinomadura decatromicini]